ncbi:MAG: hypothetical protein IPJ40_09565 [Saprospirales bacterium]|nr:hypothetical protein [Saprospirales bacterium]
MSILLLLGLPSFLFAQDTLILHSGKKLRSTGSTGLLPIPNMSWMEPGITCRSMILTRSFGGCPGICSPCIYFMVLAEWKMNCTGSLQIFHLLVFPIGNYAERDHEYQYFTGGPMFQYGHSVKGRNVIGVWGGVESFGSFYARESWERHTDEYISVGARKFLHYFHLALSPYYRTYFFRNKFHLQLGPYVGMLKYNLDIFYQNSNTIVGVNDRYEGEIHDIIYHPGLQAGVGWNWAHEKNGVFSLEIQWHHGFGQKIEEFRYKNVVLVDEYDLKPTQFLFGLKYSIR